MLMTGIKLKIPADAKTLITDTTTEQLRNALLLYPSIANDTISHGKAAELLGMHKADLIELYGNLGIPYLDMTDEEFDEEVNTVKNWQEKHVIVIYDTTPIFSLLKAGRLDLLQKLYESVIIPEAIYNGLTIIPYLKTKRRKLPDAHF